MVLTQRLLAMVEEAKKDKLEKIENGKRKDSEKQEKALAALKQILIHGLGNKFWKELESSGATIEVDCAKFTANLLLPANDINLQIVVSTDSEHKGKVKAVITVYESNNPTFSAKAQYVSSDEVSEGCLKQSVLLAFSQMEI
jgi:hypothetical protein